MSQPALQLLSLAQKLYRLSHTRNYAMNHVVQLAQALGYPRKQAKDIVRMVYAQYQSWRSWG
jgi:hypothetical protein